VKFFTWWRQWCRALCLNIEINILCLRLLFLLLLLYCYCLHLCFWLSCICYSLLTSYSSLLLVDLTHFYKKAIKRLNSKSRGIQWRSSRAFHEESGFTSSFELIVCIILLNSALFAIRLILHLFTHPLGVLSKFPFKLNSYSSWTDPPYLQLNTDYQIKIKTHSTNSNQDILL